MDRMTLTEEKALIARCKTDPSAFGTVYDAHFSAIFRYILHRIGNVAIAEDLAAQTFFNALRNLWKFRWTGVSILSWLYRIATNEINGFLRRHKNRTFTGLDDLAEQLPDSGHQPDQELEAAENLLAEHKTFLLMGHCLRQLKPDEQTLLTLRYFDKKSFAEIAPILGKREGALRMQCSRALDKLKILLSKEGFDDERYRNTFGGDDASATEGRAVSAESAPKSAEFVTISA